MLEKIVKHLNCFDLLGGIDVLINIHLDKPYYWEKGDTIQFDFYPVINDRCIDQNGVVKRILGYSIKFNCEKY